MINFNDIDLIERVQVDLRIYCEGVIVPDYIKKYDNFNLQRLRDSIEISLRLAEEMYLDFDMVYVIAIFHEATFNESDINNFDTLLLVQEQDELLKYFEDEQINLIALACSEFEGQKFDRREFSSIYSKVIADADRLSFLDTSGMVQELWNTHYSPNSTNKELFDYIVSICKERYSEEDLEVALVLKTSYELYKDKINRAKNSLSSESNIAIIVKELHRYSLIKMNDDDTLSDILPRHKRENLTDKLLDISLEDILNEPVFGDEILIEDYSTPKEDVSFLNEAKINQPLYHISLHNLDGEVLKPRIPDNFMVRQGYEDSTTKRVSFCKSIDGCLMALSQDIKGLEFYVHEPANYDDIDIQYIGKVQVPDSEVTGEVWVTNNCKLKTIAKIRVGKAQPKPYPYEYGGKYKAELFKWNYTVIETLSESTNVLLESMTPQKRKSIEALVQKVFTAVDPSGINTKRYVELNSKFTDAQFTMLLDRFLESDDQNFYLEILPNKNEPTLRDIKKALDILGVPTDEYVYYRHEGHKDDPIRTSYPVPVGYLTLRRVQQILSKKNTYSLDISQRNMKTGQVTSDSKIARISDVESYSLVAIGADNALKEFLGPRADNTTAKTDMYRDISLYGSSFLKDMSKDLTENQTLNTLAVYLLGAGLGNDLLKEDGTVEEILQNKVKTQANRKK